MKKVLLVAVLTMPLILAGCGDSSKSGGSSNPSTEDVVPAIKNATVTQMKKMNADVTDEQINTAISAFDKQMEAVKVEKVEDCKADTTNDKVVICNVTMSSSAAGSQSGTSPMKFTKDEAGKWTLAQ